MGVSYETVDLCREKGTNRIDEIVNNSGEPSIHFATESYLYDFDESKIKSIEILD